MIFGDNVSQLLVSKRRLHVFSRVLCLMGSRMNELLAVEWMAFSKSKEWTFRSEMNGLFEVEGMNF